MRGHRPWPLDLWSPRPCLLQRVQSLLECPAPLGAVKIVVVDRVLLSLLYLKVHKYWAFFLKDASNFGLENLGVTELLSKVGYREMD